MAKMRILSRGGVFKNHRRSPILLLGSEREMKSYIKEIIIFNKLGEKRTVPLNQGVNIITGESKTGKSALVEIIDYCLCSTRCTIPKGKITDFSHFVAEFFEYHDFQDTWRHHLRQHLYEHIDQKSSELQRLRPH